MGSDDLREKAWNAEDEGKEVYVHTSDRYDGVVEYIEIDGVETYNEDYRDELDDAYWTADAYESAEGSWRE